MNDNQPRKYQPSEEERALFPEFFDSNQEDPVEMLRRSPGTGAVARPRLEAWLTYRRNHSRKNEG